MPGQRKTPKKPPVRQRVTREQVYKPIREVITHPAERIPIRAMAAANKLKGTVKGNTGKGKKEWQPKEPSSGNDRLPLPPNFNRKPDGTFMTPQEVYEAYVAPGTYNITQSQMDSYARLYITADIERRAREAYENNPVAQAMEFIDSAIQVAGNVPGILTGDASSVVDANIEANNAMNALRRIVGQPTQHLTTQTRVGGTKGTPRPVDRSAAIKKAWETRKKLYGSSGQKGK